MGADLTLDLEATTADARRQAVLDATHGEGADVVIEAAGAAAAIAEGLDLARVGGRYVIAGHYTDVGPTARSTRTSRSTASTSRSAAAGAARRATSCARCRSSSAIRRFRSAKIGARRYGLDPAERGARRRRGDAHPESAGRSVAVTHASYQDRRDARPGQQRARRSRGAGRRRRGRLPAQLLARHARVARADVPRGARRRRARRPPRRHPAGSQRSEDPHRHASAAASRSTLHKGDELRLARAATKTRAGPGASSPPYARADRVGRAWRSAAAGRREDRAAGARAARRRARHRGRQRRQARRAQGHQRARRGAAGGRGDREGRRRT